MLGTLRSRWTRLSEALRGSVRAVGAFARRSLQLSSAALHKGLRSLVPRSSTNVVDSEAQPLNQDLDVLAGNKCILKLPDIPISDLEAPSIKWLLETSSDPEVFLAAASLVPQVEYPLDLDVSDILPQLHDIYISCVGLHGQIIPSLEEKALACRMALSHLYCGRVLQAYPGRGEFIGRGRSDYDVFDEFRLMGVGIADLVVLATAMHLCLPEDGDLGFRCYGIQLDYCSDSVLEWLSHSLPYHFITGRVDEGVERFAIAVISKLLPSPSSPSNQIIANCILLACVMIGVQFDKKDIVRIDKSSALPEITRSLLTQFQKVLWACDGGDLDADSTGVTRRAWNLLAVIGRMLEPAKQHYSSSDYTMRNLDACRKIYLRARSSEQNHDLLNALRNALHFTLTAAKVSRDPASLWDDQIFWMAGSHSPEDFDWLVDYLDYIHFDDREVAYDILLLLGVMKVHCSPAKQHQFIENLIACMGSNMPHNLRHAALRAAHRAREEITAIDDAELRDIILTKFSPAILTAVCPQPGAKLPDDGPDRFFHHYRDLCYLELVFALARNSNWHPHLFGDHHIDRCISMIAECDAYILHAFYLVGILLRVAPDQLSVAPLDAITEQQWWDMMSRAWTWARYIIGDIHCFEFLPVLVEGTKRHIQITSEIDLGQLISNVDDVLDALERRDSEQGEGDGVVVTVRELRTVASDMLSKLVNSEGVTSP
ncbi:hypothetical protein BDR05DRAFT_488122 [Suillus weaverae]|nr:hypothetical protein BDR05DRAFT_488122 [Suillus weaverae]